ncbi:MAG: hypothetical protein BRC59_03520 [Cyanobacteria bacterium SW_4_48_29]|nr:MAG: hypothetical protein BRC59_03520 [Cyanobacteria bacterium SW_4_48_29]
MGAQHADQIELFYLPPYSPERNPDEYLNQDIKAHVRRQRRPHHVAALKQMVRAYLHQLQQWPEKLSHFFWLPRYNPSATVSSQSELTSWAASR